MHRYDRPRALKALLIAWLGAAALGVSVWLILASAGGPSVVSASSLHDPSPPLIERPPSAPVAPDVRRRLSAASEVAPLRLIVVLRAPSDAGPPPLLPFSADRATRLARHLQVQQANFEQAKAPLAPMLSEARRAGSLTRERDLWLVNAVAIEATPAVAWALIASPAVAAVHLDQYVQYVEPAADFAVQGAIDATVIERPWGLDAVDAPRAWQTFAISGTGAVVAVMDTGVDWQHPDLKAAYRGNAGKELYHHVDAWYDAVNGGTYPYDDHGHGTHVAGTAVGASTGVAPGARWVGVKVLNSEGFGYDSWILDGFQWLLAPHGDPSLAPDVVNASWSSNDRDSTVFLEAIQALEAAGIFSTFAAGNSGPQAGSVGSPASNPGVLATGAVDPDGDVASFSGRGPSSWEETKPLVVAPGVNVVSSAPGGVYLLKSGTSMATPHVAGLGALMRSVSPTISVAAMRRVMTETARPLTATLPNNDSGWGQIDVYQALVGLIKPALLSGTVTAGGSPGSLPQPISGATVTAWPDTVIPGEGPGIRAATDAQGRYSLALMPGPYAVRVDAFGYSSQSVGRVDVTEGPPHELDFALTAMPTGRVQGRILIDGTGETPTTTLRVRALDTPVEAQVTGGLYGMDLPGGHYTLEVRGSGYRVVTATLAISIDATVDHDFVVQSAPTVLLIDEGAWYYGSQLNHWTRSLDALRYTYDVVRIKDTGRDLPIVATSSGAGAAPTTTLAAYDVVLWSSPLGSPGLIGAGSVLSSYLASGGGLLVSGQDVAYLDGGGSLYGGLKRYLVDQMGVQYVADTSESSAIAGTGPFAGLHLDIQGGTGADNQASPDVVAARDVELASVPLMYAGGGGAGVAAHTCVPYRALFFSFGFEAIAEAGDRREVLDRSLDWLAAAPPTSGLAVDPLTAPTLIGLPGERVTHVLKVRHTGYAGTDETVRLTVSPAAWSTDLSDTLFELAPCTSALLTVTVTIPPNAAVNASDTVWISARSDSVPAGVSSAVTTKTPASVLLVDDDRWYPVEAAYREALDSAGVVYDLWDTRSGKGGLVGAASPSTETLHHYPIVVWFTGYDWYAPVEAAEAAGLLTYLDHGGKLLLSSQDFVYHHQDHPLTTRLGIMLADWADQAKEAYGVPQHPAGQSWSAEGLDYPFPNWSHTVEPLPAGVPVVRGQLGQPIAIAMGEPEDGGDAGSRTLFYAFPLEALPLQARRHALANGVGWLSPLGGSTWRVSPRTAGAGDTVAFELEVKNSGAQPLVAEAVHRVPDAFVVDSATLPAELSYDPATGEVTWQGTVAPGSPVRLAWEAPWLGGDDQGHPTVTLSLPTWDIAFVREAPFYGTGLDLVSAQWEPGGREPVRTGEPLTLTYTIYNASANGPADVTLSFWMMTGLGPLSATTPLTSGLAVAGWQGTLGPFASHVVTIPIRGALWDRLSRIDALLTTATGGRWEDAHWLTFEPWRSYLPAIR